MSEGAQMNGPASPSGKFIDTIDPDDPEYRRNLQRPAEVKEDMKQMEGRSRVSVVLNSQAFKEELEAIIHEQIRQGGPASIFALQQISDLLLPQSRGTNSSFGRSSPVIPINDIRGVETFGYTKQEKVLRCKLAGCYRLVDLFGWTHGIFNHISARLSQEHEQFLVNPFGMVYSEITASTLVKVDVRGEIVDTGSTGLGISKASFTLHSAIHQARPDIRCIIHLHTPAAVAVSATKCGLLPMSQEALICGKVSYHDYRGILVDQDERDQLCRSLGPFNKVMFLRNHGVVACGETIEEAFHYAFNVMAAVEAQVKAMPVGLDNLILVDEETQERTFKVGSQGGGGADTSGRKWRCGELEWDALMRTLDNSGYRTGHLYKQPLMKQEKKERTNSDVEVPPASSSFTYVFDGDYEHSKYVSPIKTAMERQKQAYKAGWLTSPNTYKKEEIEEIGTTTPKKITKWVPDGDTQQKSTVIKIDTPNQFAPQGSNPKEFQQKQKSIRKDYYEEKVTAGPQSKILEGLSWDEAAKLKEGGDQTVIVGAASKGIIQRDHQHNAVVYRSYYAANPFENMSEEEVDAYKREVERRERGEEPEDVPGPDGRLISTEERMQHIQQSREDVQQDTEENTTQETNNDSIVNESQSEREHSPQPAASPKEPWRMCDPLPHASQLEKEGLDRLVDTVVQAVLASALPASLSKGQHSPGGNGRVAGSSHVSPYDSTPSSSSGPFLVSQLLPTTPPEGEVIPPAAAVETSQSENMVRTSVKASAVKVGGTVLEEGPEMMTVQLQPLKLFQGKPGAGAMKISFTIQSKVTRRKTKGPRGSWPIENVTIMQTQPKVTIVPPEEGREPGKKKPKVLQEQQNVIRCPPAEEGAPAVKVPLSPNYQQKPAKRSHQSSGRRHGRFKKKYPRWVRRGLTHPLSPVKEEFLEEEDTLEALLARQTVEVDSDESLEDLLLMTDNYKENLVPSHNHDVKCEPAAVSDKSAPIATPEDLDESGHLSLPNTGQEEQPEEQLSSISQQPVFTVHKADATEPSPDYPGQDSCGKVPPSAPLTDEEGTLSDELALDEGEIRFADEEASNTLSEASDGDIAPRKQEEDVARPQLPASDVDCEEEGVDQEFEDQHDAASPNESEPASDPGNKCETSEPSMEPTSDPGNKCETIEPSMMSQSAHESPLESAPASAALDIPVIHVPLAHHEEELADVSGPATSSPMEEENKATLYRTDSTSLETSPIVNSPPFDALAPEPIHRELHRVRSLENELDEPSNVKRRPKKGHGVVRRVQSAGPVEHRNFAIIDAILHTVTVDPAKIAKSGQPVSTYLSGSPEKTSASTEKRKKWTLMDSVSKSLEDLDVDELAQKGSKIYGRSLEISIRDGVLPEQVAQTPASGTAKSRSLEDLLDDRVEAETVTSNSTRVYKDDVVVITPTPMDFSAISPQAKKDILEEEGPLVTSSPKLGRRKEGSFKKYQSKMGKSEETLLEVMPLSADRGHQSARRSKSFPKNFGRRKNRSRETLLDEHPSLFRSDAEQETKRSTQSMSILDERSGSNGCRNKSRETVTSDSPSLSRLSLDNQLLAHGEKRSKETLMDDAPSPANTNESKGSERRLGIDEPRRRRRRQRSLETNSDQPRRRRRKAQAEEETEPAHSDPRKDEAAPEDDMPRPPNSRRERRRRQQRGSDEGPSREASDPREVLSADGLEGEVEPREEKIQTRVAENTGEKTRDADLEVPGAAPPASDADSPQMGDFPPPPEDLLREGQELVVGEALPGTEIQTEGTQLPEVQQRGQDEQSNRNKDEDEKNGPPRVRRPQKKVEKQPKHGSAEVMHTLGAEESVEDKDVLRRKRHEKISSKESPVEDSIILSTFRQPARASQKLGEDFPSLCGMLATQPTPPVPGDEKHRQEEKTPKDQDAEPSSTLEPEDTVPIAGNLDVLDYGDEPPRVRRSGQRRPHTSSDENDSQRSQARQRAGGRRRGTINDQRKETESQNSGSEVGLSRPYSDLKVVENSASRESLTSKENLSGRNSTASRSKLASRESLASREDGGSRTSGLDIVNYDNEPPRARRSRHRPEPNRRDGNHRAENAETEKPRSVGRIRGRREARGDSHPESNGSGRRGPRQENLPPPEIQVQVASRESIDQEELAPPLPPKKYRSIEHLAEFDREPCRARLRELLDKQPVNVQDVPPALPPKKNKLKKLSCVGGSEIEMAEPKHDAREDKLKGRSSSKERKKLPPPPPLLDSDEEYREEPRRRHGRQECNLLRVPADDSFHRESSFDASFERDRQHSSRRRKETESTSQYYGDAEDEPDAVEDDFKSKGERKSPKSDVTLSPPHTPRPARKISTGSYGSVSTRPTRSVSFDDGYTPTMSHLPQRQKSRESLGSESSLPSTGYRMRSHSGASETSLSSNPLNHEPWRAKAFAQRPHSRPRRSRSQGEATYSANAGRRRRSRTPTAGDTNRLYQPRRTRSRGSLPDTPSRSAAPSQPSNSRDTSMLADDSFSDAYSHGYASESMPSAPVRRSDSERQPEKNRELIRELERKAVGRSKSDRRSRGEGDGDKPGSPSKSDPMDSASGGETLEERSSKEGSPTKEAPSPTKDKKKKKKFRMPSFSKKKKDSKESTI